MERGAPEPLVAIWPSRSVNKAAPGDHFIIISGITEDLRKGGKRERDGEKGGIEGEMEKREEGKGGRKKWRKR